MDHQIIIIGGNHQNTLTMVRALGRKYSPIDVIIENSNESECYISVSKYVGRCYYIINEQEILQILQENYLSTEKCPVIITCTDKSAAFLDKKYDILIQHFYFFNAGETGRISSFLSKHNQVQLASKLGLTVPSSHIYLNGSPIPKEIKYPCLLKPLSSTLLAKRADICNNQEGLQNVLTEYPQGCQILIQQYIEREYEIVVDGISANNEVFIPGYVRKIRDNINGGTSFMQSYHINTLPPSFVEKMREMVRRIHYDGLFGFEFIYTKGQYYFLEINFRNDATTYAIVRAGVNLPELFVESVIAKESHYPDNFQVRPIFSMSELADLRNSRNIYHISIFQWIKDIYNTDCFFLFDKEDKKPFWKAIRCFIFNKAKRIKK